MEEIRALLGEAHRLRVEAVELNNRAFALEEQAQALAQAKWAGAPPAGDGG